MKLHALIACLVLAIVMTIPVAAQRTPAVNFSAEALDGRLIELDQLRGKVVVMTFWSTKCIICVEEIPQLNQLKAKYAGRDVVFLGLTTDNFSNVENFLAAKPFNFEILPGSFGVLMKYADRDRNGNISMGFPAYFIVNQNGEVEMKDSGWDKIKKVDSQVNSLLAQGVAKKD